MTYTGLVRQSLPLCRRFSSIPPYDDLIPLVTKIQARLGYKFNDLSVWLGLYRSTRYFFAKSFGAHLVDGWCEQDRLRKQLYRSSLPYKLRGTRPHRLSHIQKPVFSCVARHIDKAALAVHWGLAAALPTTRLLVRGAPAAALSLIATAESLRSRISQCLCLQCRTVRMILQLHRTGAGRPLQPCKGGTLLQRVGNHGAASLAVVASACVASPVCLRAALPSPLWSGTSSRRVRSGLPPVPTCGDSASLLFAPLEALPCRGVHSVSLLDAAGIEYAYAVAVLRMLSDLSASTLAAITADGGEFAARDAWKRGIRVLRTRSIRQHSPSVDKVPL